MTEGKTYTGGLAEVSSAEGAKGAGDDGAFLAIEYSLSQNFAIYYVAGEVCVPNPGIEAKLRYRVPQGTNPKILMLNLVLIQRPGIWPQVETLVSARYIRMGKPGQYTEVDIYGHARVPVVKLP